MEGGIVSSTFFFFQLQLCLGPSIKIDKYRERKRKRKRCTILYQSTVDIAWVLTVKFIQYVVI